LGSVFPVNDVFDILFFDTETITVSHGTLEQNFDANWELVNSFIVELGEVVILIGVSIYLNGSKVRVEWIF
jgi:hypothetical protein